MKMQKLKKAHRCVQWLYTVKLEASICELFHLKARHSYFFRKVKG